MPWTRRLNAGYGGGLSGGQGANGGPTDLTAAGLGRGILPSGQFEARGLEDIHTHVEARLAELKQLVESDALALKDMAAQGVITGAIVDGPFTPESALSVESALTSSYSVPVSVTEQWIVACSSVLSAAPASIASAFVTK